MKLTNIQNNTTINRYERYEYKKDSFRVGEYSIYLRAYYQDQTSTELKAESYAFGVSKRYEAEAICTYLNRTLEEK